MQKIPSYKEVIDSTIFKEFLNSANEYCSFIENQKLAQPEDYLKALQKILLTLYQNALKLETIELETDKIIETSTTFSNIEEVSGYLGPNRYYWHKFNPVVTDNEPLVCGDLLDDIGDIYLDLKEGITLLNHKTDDAMENAVFGFKFDFDAHWSKHCIDALYAIHYFLQPD